MAISTSNSPGGQGHFEKDADNQHILFPSKTATSHIVDITSQPVTFIATGFPAGVFGRLQISTDRVQWSDWRVHGKYVELSAENTMQWINFSGNYRITLVDVNGQPYQGAVQPRIVWYPATTTHEKNWALVGSQAAIVTPPPPPSPPAPTQRIEAMEFSVPAFTESIFPATLNLNIVLNGLTAGVNTVVNFEFDLSNCTFVTPGVTSFTVVGNLVGRASIAIPVRVINLFPFAAAAVLKNTLYSVKSAASIFSQFPT